MFNKLKMKNMKKLLKKLDWIFDYYVGFFMTNGNKVEQYHEFMKNKWGDKYK